MYFQNLINKFCNGEIATYSLGRLTLIVPVDLTRRDIIVAYQLLKPLRSVLEAWVSVDEKDKDGKP